LTMRTAMTKTTTKTATVPKLQGRSRKSGSNLVFHIVFYICNFIEV
jgi:hypothetical protein